MKALHWFLLLLLAAPAAAQTTYLSEDFESGVVPPPGWVESTNGISVGWEASSGNLYGSTEAFHDDFVGLNQNFLISPPMDLRAASSIYAHCYQFVRFAAWRDHHHVDVTLDNGITFAMMHDDLAGDGLSGISVNLGAFGGLSGVSLAFHYIGDNASEWSIDNIEVNDSATPPPPPPPAILDTLVNPANGNTYHLLESSNWTAAEAAAVALGGHLATVDDQAENDWIYQSFGGWGGQGRDLWIGFNDVANPNNFVWSSGSTSTYTNWAPGQPDNNGGIESYTHIYGLGSPYHPGLWNDMFDTAGATGSFGYFGVVEIDRPAPQIAVRNLVGGLVATLDGSFFTPGGAVRIGYSLVGGGPVNTPYGDLELSPPVHQMPLILADPTGDFSMSVPIRSTLTGRPIWIHAFDALSLVFSNSLAEVVG